MSPLCIFSLSHHHTHHLDLDSSLICNRNTNIQQTTMSMASSFSYQFGGKRLIIKETSCCHKWVPPRYVNLPKHHLKRRYSPIKSVSNRNGGFAKKLNGIVDRDGIIIVDHGSRRKESNLKLDEFVAMFRERTGYPIVEPAHMELAEPSLRDAFGVCVEQGATRVIVSPFFLFPGRHWLQDIPSLTAEAAKDHPKIPYIITAPLGHHELLVDVVDDIIQHCLSHVVGDADECSVCAGTGKCRLYSL